MALTKPWSQQSAQEKKQSLNYILVVAGALFLVVSWFAMQALLILPFIGAALIAFGFRERIAAFGSRKEEKERQEYARLKLKFEGKNVYKRL